jgi:hypothetical protein
MMLKRHAPLALIALATGWIAPVAATPAMADDRRPAIVAGGEPANQGPHGFGDPMASGSTQTGPTISRSYYDTGPHSFSDPATSGRVATGSTAPPFAVNRGPHAF